MLLLLNNFVLNESLSQDYPFTQISTVSLSDLWPETSIANEGYKIKYFDWNKVVLMEGVCVTIENPAFCLFLYLTGVHFRGELQHIGDVISKKSSVDQSELEK